MERLWWVWGADGTGPGTIDGVAISDGSIDTVDLADDAVDSTKLLDEAVTADKIAPDAVNSSKILDGSINDDDLATDSVTTIKIQDSAITSAKIADGTITDADINASAAISQSKISGLSTSLSAKANITTEITAGIGLTGGGDLSANSTISLANTTVTPNTYTRANITVDAQGRITSASNGSALSSSDLTDNSITSAKIDDGTITAADLGLSSVTTVKIQNNAVTEAKIADNSVTLAKLADATCGADEVLKRGATTWECISESLINQRPSDNRLVYIDDDSVKYTEVSGGTMTVKMNDGKYYTAASPLTFSFTNPNGDGGLDTGSESDTTEAWYYLYAIPAATANTFTITASRRSPLTDEYPNARSWSRPSR